MSKRVQILSKQGDVTAPRRAADRRVSSAAPEVHDVLRSPGQPLDTATRAVMEPRFGHDFSQIRVHTDSEAADSAHAVNALAYTVGEDVVFGRGQYRPSSLDGQKLIAHELTHTLQQSGGSSVQESGPSESGPSERALEGEAEALSHAAMEGQNVRVGARAPLSLRRQPAPGTPPAPATAPVAKAGTDPNTINGFVTGHAEISPTNMAKLQGIATRVLDSQKSHPGSKVLVVGHTDAQGNEGDNMALGMRRAVATRDALITMHVPAAVLVPVSRGQSEPVDDSGKKDNPLNRRAEVKFEPAPAPAAPTAPKLDPNPPPAPTPQFQDPHKDPRLFPQPQWPQADQPKVRPPYRPPTPEPPTIPPVPKGMEPKSLLQQINEGLDREINRIARAMGLPKWAQEKARDLAHAAFLKGTTAGLAAALAGLGVDAKGQKAMVDFVEAALKENRWQGPPP